MRPHILFTALLGLLSRAICGPFPSTGTDIVPRPLLVARQPVLYSLLNNHQADDARDIYLQIQLTPPPAPLRAYIIFKHDSKQELRLGTNLIFSAGADSTLRWNISPVQKEVRDREAIRTHSILNLKQSIHMGVGSLPGDSFEEAIEKIFKGWDAIRKSISNVDSRCLWFVQYALIELMEMKYVDRKRGQAAYKNLLHKLHEARPEDKLDCQKRNHWSSFVGRSMP